MGGVTWREFARLTAYADEVEAYRQAVVALAGMNDGI